MCVGLFLLACVPACLIYPAAGYLLVMPPRLVVEYGAPAFANCSTNESSNGMGWESSQGAVDMQNVKFLNWTVPNLTLWDIKPMCYININQTEKDQETQELQITIYKIPDSVSCSFRNHSGSVIEGEPYTLLCSIQNVAPVEALKVEWYKQNSLLDTVTFDETSQRPVNQSVSLLIHPRSTDDGTKYWCRAKLELGPEGPQPSPTMTSKPLSIDVHYKPMFLSSMETIYQGDSDNVNCTVKANPPAKYTWNSQNLKSFTNPVVSLDRLSPGNHTCTATNDYGQATKLFIIKPKSGRTVFWAVLGSGLALAALLIVCYIVKQISSKKSANKKPSSSGANKEEATELVLTEKK